MDAAARSPQPSRPGPPSVIVVGAGFGGLGAAAALRRVGITDVTILERAEDVGGVWRDNTYPGAACDVPSPLYSWSWATNPDWSRRYSGQPDILDYIRRTAAEHGLRDLVRFGTTVTAATYDEQRHRWRVRTTTGELEADLLVSAVGQLSNPVIPRIPGSFDGPSFHSAQWRHDVDLKGKRVAVVGTGASAIQFVPGIVDRVGAMTVFQRSAPYVVPKPDAAYGERHRRMFRRFPATLAAERRAVFWVTERFNAALEGTSPVTRPLLAAVENAWRLMLRRQVPDPVLRAKLVPDYTLGCKRLLFSNAWYPALARDHVDVVTEEVTGLEPTGVRTADGVLHEVDVVIWGTGFAATQFLAPMTVTGVGGRDLHEEWSDGARAHLGITVPGFPNLFCIYGPNTNLGGSSIIAMQEAQSAYVAQVARRIADGDARALGVRPDVADAYDREMQTRLSSSVWSGCTSWYRDGTRITTNWPGQVREYQRRTSVVAWDELEEIG
ncbi:NAD(P)/FAD-dependent oxidoreductase [Nocardioides sp. KIGAM211]|uniref:NAD(P)/FAD-dependent oxidoreductase n=1 Tax=Nocardioides luti TaxID=2761101 RepID=A0A7X0VCQ7_9ACTN|nr:NAD(P)/FAD-dependent oxidoreductase [Nocardioides luti]MBB6629292.1 NAD(P)/FAD-dependent oxidoreductase [Nocardioides luti]